MSYIYQRYHLETQATAMKRQQREIIVDVITRKKRNLEKLEKKAW